MTCEECALLLLDFHFDTLEPHRSNAVKLHLAECDKCTATLARLDVSVPDQLAWPDEAPPAGLADRVIEAARKEQAPLTEQAAARRARDVVVPPVWGARPRELEIASAPRPPTPARRGLKGAAAVLLLVVGGWAMTVMQREVTLVAAIDGQDHLTPGSLFTLRASVFSLNGSQPLQDAKLKVLLRDGAGKSTLIFEGPSNQYGTLEAGTRLPELPEGKYTLELAASRNGESTTLSKEVVVERRFRVLVSSDKPMYQPGQVIHSRAIVRESGSGKPPAGSALVFTVIDPKGNKVGRQSVKVDAFGVASFDFPLADEILMGTWRVEAEMAGASSALDLTVARYSLPKFQVKVTTAKSWYRPGDVVTGRVECRTFFGKSAAGAKVKITAGVFIDKFRPVGETAGTADSEGVLGFELALPKALPGLAIQSGSAAVDLSLEVTDSAGERVEKHVPLIVARQPFSVSAVPSGGTLVPNVDNDLLVMVVRPDGEPVAGAKVTLVSALGTPQAVTAEDGIAQVVYRPTSSRRDLQLRVVGTDGEELMHYAELESDSLPGVIRTAKTLYTAGDTITGEVLAASPAGVFFLDVVRDGSTIATHTVPLVSGKGTFSFELPAEASGTVTLYAYLPGRELKRARRTLFVSEPRSLKVAITSAQETVAPGQDTTLTVKVLGDDGKGVATSVGLSVVDESVFAMVSKEPALLKAYFLLAEELSRPKFELDPASVVSSNRDRAATLLFSQPRESEVRRIGATTEQEISARRDALTQKKSNAEKVGFSLGLLLLGVIFEGGLRFAFEKFFGGFFSGKPWRTAALVTGGGIALLAKVEYRANEFELFFWAIAPLLAVLLLELIIWAMESGWATALSVMGTGMACVVVFMTIFGPNLRALFATSASMLGGSTQRPLRNERVGTGVKRISNFSNYDDGPRGAPAPEVNADFNKKFEADPAAQEKASAAPEMEKAKAKNLAPASKEEKASVRVRSWFPETMFWTPSLITNGDGLATVKVPVADSITSWRISAVASAGDGRLGVGQGALRVFQDFFVDIEVPPALTVGDEVELPIAVHNYLSEAQTVKLEVEAGDWFVTQTPAVQEVVLAAGEVKGVPLRLRAVGFGKKSLTVYAFGSKLKDAVRRDVEVRPDGVRVEKAVGGPLGGEQRLTAAVPVGAIAGSEKVLLRVYPGLLSAALEGIEGIFRMPGGCFEQTSSTTYPNVLVLDYLRRNHRAKPELELKAIEYIQLGYQRLLSFEVKGGGFEWFGRAPANQVLTAYGLLEFADMAHVYEIDPAVIRRTQEWLISRQRPDGAWDADRSNLRDGLYRDDFSGRIGVTAYITWALVESGYRGDATDRALGFLRSRVHEVEGVYTKALVANALLGAGQESAASMLVDAIEKAAVTEGKLTHFPADGQTAVYSRGSSADSETTALAVLALSRAGKAEKLGPALDWLLAARDANGAWGSTQATVLALRTLLGAASAGQDPTASGEIKITVAGETIQALQLRPETSDLVQTIDLSKFAKAGKPLEVSLSTSGSVKAQYQLVTLAYVPKPRREDALALTLDYDRATLAPDDTITARVKATYTRAGASGMVMLALGVPPGFEVDAGSVGALVAAGKIGKFTLTGKELLLYVDALRQNEPVEYSYKLVARYPVKVKAPTSVAYLYYQPEVRAESTGRELFVKR